jgi:hypothetical protein
MVDAIVRVHGPSGRGGGGKGRIGGGGVGWGGNHTPP